MSGIRGGDRVTIWQVDPEGWAPEEAELGTALGLAADATSPGHHINTPSNRYGAWHTFGNTENSMGFAGQGDPQEAWAPLVGYTVFGEDGLDVEATTQGVAFIARYESRTVDDSAQCGSAFVILDDADTAQFDQAKQAVAWEMSAQASGTVHHTGGVNAPMGAAGSRLNVLDTATVDVGYGFKIGTQVAAGATLTDYRGFWQPAAADADTAYGVYVEDTILSRTGLRVDENGGDGAFKVDTRTAEQSGSAFAYIQGCDGQTTRTTLRVQGIASQTARMTEWFQNGIGYAVAGVSSAGVVFSTSGLQVANSAGVRQGGFNNSGVMFCKANAAPADGALNNGEMALWFDATPGAAKLMIKAKNSSGTVVTGQVALS